MWLLQIHYILHLARVFSHILWSRSSAHKLPPANSNFVSFRKILQQTKKLPTRQAVAASAPDSHLHVGPCVIGISLWQRSDKCSVNLSVNWSLTLSARCKVGSWEENLIAVPEMTKTAHSLLLPTCLTHLGNTKSIPNSLSPSPPQSLHSVQWSLPIKGILLSHSQVVCNVLPSAIPITKSSWSPLYTLSPSSCPQYYPFLMIISSCNSYVAAQKEIRSWKTGPVTGFSLWMPLLIELQYLYNLPCTCLLSKAYHTPKCNSRIRKCLWSRKWFIQPAVRLQLAIFWSHAMDFLESSPNLNCSEEFKNLIASESILHEDAPDNNERSGNTKLIDNTYVPFAKSVRFHFRRFCWVATTPILHWVPRKRINGPPNAKAQESTIKCSICSTFAWSRILRFETLVCMEGWDRVYVIIGPPAKLHAFCLFSCSKFKQVNTLGSYEWFQTVPTILKTRNSTKDGQVSWDCEAYINILYPFGSRTSKRFVATPVIEKIRHLLLLSSVTDQPWVPK